MDSAKKGYCLIFKNESMKEHNDPLNTKLFSWEKGDDYNIRKSLQSTLILGETGAGKTSSSFLTLADCYLSKGYGILAMTTKNDETAKWIKLCKANNREDDLIIFNPHSGHTFNFFDYICSMGGTSAKGIAHNVADIIATVIKAGHADQSHSNNHFWSDSLDEIILNSVELCMMTQNNRFDHICKVVLSAPRNEAQLANKEWLESSHCFQLMNHLATSISEQKKTKRIHEEENKLKQLEIFYYKRWLNLAEKTRSILEIMFGNFSSKFLREPIRSLMCNSESTVTPEDTIRGKVIVIDMPYLSYDKIGRDVQLLWKLLWQKTMQNRTITNRSRPCANFIDEFQYFATEHDPNFQSTCRSFRACSVYATQNLPNVYLNLGTGETGKNRFKAIAGNMTTKFFHANSDPDTNEFASNLIGKIFKWNRNTGETMGENISFSSGQSEALQYIVDPSEFANLKTGGPENDFYVQAIVHRQGKKFKSTGYNYKKVTLKQLLL